MPYDRVALEDRELRHRELKTTKCEPNNPWCILLTVAAILAVLTLLTSSSLRFNLQIHKAEQDLQRGNYQGYWEHLGKAQALRLYRFSGNRRTS